MNIDLQTRGFELTRALEESVRKHLCSAIGGRQFHIRSLRVRLLDINGPRGGADKRCRVHIGLPRLRDVVVETTDADMYKAIARASARAGGALERRLNRQRARIHRTGWRCHPGSDPQGVTA